MAEQEITAQARLRRSVDSRVTMTTQISVPATSGLAITVRTEIGRDIRLRSSLNRTLTTRSEI